MLALSFVCILEGIAELLSAASRVSGAHSVFKTRYLRDDLSSPSYQSRRYELTSVLPPELSSRLAVPI
jgi:hypothetical protein